MRGQGKGTGGNNMQVKQRSARKLQARSCRGRLGVQQGTLALSHSLFPVWHQALEKGLLSSSSSTVSPLVPPPCPVVSVFLYLPISIFLSLIFHFPNRVSATVSFPRGINSLRSLPGFFLPWSPCLPSSLPGLACSSFQLRALCSSLVNP